MNLGFVVNNISNSELSYDLINAINDNKDISSYIFFKNHLPTILTPKCMTMSIFGLSNFKGKAVAFDLQGASVINETNCKTENYLYLYDLEWLYNKIDYIEARNILDKFTIFARSESHKNIIENYCDKEVKVVKTMKELISCLK